MPLLGKVYAVVAEDVPLSVREVYAVAAEDMPLLIGEVCTYAVANDNMPLLVEEVYMPLPPAYVSQGSEGYDL